MGGTDDGNYHRFQRQRSCCAAPDAGQLLQIPGANTRHGGSELLLGVESVHELHPQKYGAEARDVGGRHSRDLQQRDDHVDMERGLRRHQCGQGLSDRQPHFTRQQHLERMECVDHADTVGQRRQL
ncbi:hypothetical protein SDC9_134483 [bioreactor metagenome]|uniref:Uncharacterized protein n=1 Tax=bioreactor metagenome TaxID=1076179 RepID=A0A645DDS1_9ZZZZ